MLYVWFFQSFHYYLGLLTHSGLCCYFGSGMVVYRQCFAATFWSQQEPIAFRTSRIKIVFAQRHHHYYY